MSKSKNKGNRIEKETKKQPAPVKKGGNKKK